MPPETRARNHTHIHDTDTADHLIGEIRTLIETGILGPMLPPVTALSTDGKFHIQQRHLTGATDADALERLLVNDQMLDWARLCLRTRESASRLAQAHATWVDRQALDFSNHHVYGSLIVDCFLLSWRWNDNHAAVVADKMAQLEHRFWAALHLFLERLQHDNASGIFPAAHCSGKIVSLWANPEETHNGRQRVMRAGWQAGGALAYKPRPVSGEEFFAARPGADATPSMFALINQLAGKASADPLLPLMRIHRSGRDDRDQYFWQEWIDRPAATADIAQVQGVRPAALLAPEDASGFWFHAGALAAACHAFGITDMIEGNLIVGQAMHPPGPVRLYPVDMEVFLAPVNGLRDVGVIRAPGTREHDPGIAAVVEPDALASPQWAFMPSDDGLLQLQAAPLAWKQATQPSLVIDTDLRIGYPPYLGSFLRGAFECLVLINRHRETVLRHFQQLAGQSLTRVLLRPTSEYWQVIGKVYAGDRPACTPPLTASEIEQMMRLDVPYFFRQCQSGDVQWLRNDAHCEQCDLRPSGTFLPESMQRRVDEEIEAGVLAGRNFSLIDLAALARDLLQCDPGVVYPFHAEDPLAGVVIDAKSDSTGTVRITWPAAGCMLDLSWNGPELALRKVAANPAPDERLQRAAAGPHRPHDNTPNQEMIKTVRRRLLDIDRIDANLRRRWVDDGFQDGAIKNDMDTLLTAAVRWLDEHVRAHGWPTRRHYGQAASAAAIRILQHLTGGGWAQLRLLRALHASVRQGHIGKRHLAYAVDAVRIDRGKTQIFGTKFQNVDGTLRPLPSWNKPGLARRRRSMGLDSLQRYASRLQNEFKMPASSVEHLPVRNRMKARSNRGRHG